MTTPKLTAAQTDRCELCADLYKDNAGCDEGKPLCSPHRKPVPAPAGRAAVGNGNKPRKAAGNTFDRWNLED